MPDAIELLDTLRRAGIRVALDGEDLVCDGALTPDMVQGLRAAKPEIVALLRDMQGLVQIVPDPAGRFLPFGLNENQQAYWLGRDAVFDSGQVGIQVFVELAGDLDPARLSAAWLGTVAHHDMLRARVLPDGRQQVQPDVPEWALPVTDLRDIDAATATARLDAMRQAAISHCSDPQGGRAWDLQAMRMPQGETVLLVHVDCWALDGRSLQIIAADLARLYHDAGAVLPTPALTFRDYALGMQALQDGPAYARDLAYWRDRVAALSGPPRVPVLPVTGRLDFHRHQRRLPADAVARLRQGARDRGLTLSAVLIGCYAEALARFSGQPQFTINIPRWNRHALHPLVDQVAGEFATFTMLQVDTASAPDLAGRFAGVQRQLAQDMQHGLVSGVRVLREWRRANGSGPEAVIPFVFTHEPDAAGDGRDRSWLASFGQIAPVRQSLTQTPQVWVDAQYHDLGDELLLLWDAQDARFPDGLIAQMFAAYADLVTRLAEDPQAWAGGHGIALPPDQAQRRAAANATVRPIGLPPLGDVLRDLTRVRPDAVAVVDRAGALSRAGLAHASAALARDLAARGIGAGDAVAVMMWKGAEQVVATLAIASLGAVCVPIAPDTPAQRLAQMLASAQVRLVLGSGDAACDLRVDRAALNVAPPGEWPMVQADAGLHAVLFTSGSTGVPKGVMLTHQALRNVIADGLARFRLDADSRFLSVTPLHHDMAQFDLFASLFCGGAIVLPDPDLRRDPAHWLALATTHRINFWNSVPAMMHMLLAYCATLDQPPTALAALRHATLGGDWIATDTGPRLAALAPQAQLWSVGGPTETSIWNICHPVMPQDAGRPSIPYGRPMANSQYHVLDPRGDDCPDGVAGELCCTGIGVSPGYIGDPDRTAQAFTIHPATGARMYRTGDLGLWLPDGTIQFLGRIDNQINLNGYRLELEEIETCLARHPAVTRAIAVPQRQGTLVRGVHVWVQADADAAVLTAWLRDLLPPQMQPGALHFRDDWPLTPTGKIDRRRLSSDLPQPRAAAFVPETPTERLVADAWADVVGRPVPHRDAGFFAEGGDSIAAIRLYSALLAGRVPDASVTSIFRAQTFAGLVDLIDRAVQGGAARPLHRVPRDCARHPATAAQTRLWLDEAMADQSGLYSLTFELDLAGACDLVVLTDALNRVIAEWETLRTTLAEDAEGALWQTVLDPWPITLQTGALDTLRLSEPRRPFDLAQGRNLRAALAQLGPDHHRLLLTTHHAFVDGWSFDLLLQDLALALNGRPLGRALHPVDLAAWEQGADSAAGLAWWRDRLAHRAATELPVEGARGPARAAPVQVAMHVIDARAVQGLRRAARDIGVTDFQFCLTGFAWLLRQQTRPGPILIGTHVALRDRPELAALPGMMVNNLPLVLDMDRPGSFADAAASCAVALAEAWQRGQVPFQQIAGLVAGRRDQTRHPVYGIAFTHEGMGAAPVQAGGLTLTPMPGHVARGALDMDLSMSDQADGGLLFKAAYRADLFGAERVAGLLAQLSALLMDAARDPADLQLQGDELPSLVGLFDAQMPDAPALLDQAGDVLCSFGELGRESWQIAAALAARGAGPGDTVTVMLPRGVQMVAAMLAVWRLGGHFVAISPDQPPARVDLVLTDAAPAAIIGACDDHRATLTPQDWAAQEVHPGFRAALAGRPADPVACLIYTSGTTGRPNGVEFTRRALLNRLDWQWGAHSYGPGERCVARTAVEFGDYPAEIFGPLLAGVPLCLVPASAARDPAALARAVADIGARRLLVVPSLLELLLAPDRDGPAISRMPGLALLCSSGEAMPPALVASLFAARPDLRLLNLYGSSETGADASVAELTAANPQVVIGEALPNIHIHIVDDDLQPCGPGQVGQLLVSGDCLAQGYRNAPALTAERFIIWQGQRVFRTGDLGRMGEDERITLLGRADRRIKIRGQRIELDEVHQVLRDQPGVQAAAVTTIDGPMGLQIVAVICGEDKDRLRPALQDRLPPAAIPSRILSVDEMPRTPGGKVDYQAVRRMFAITQDAAPLQGAELRLAGLWHAVLGHHPQDAQDDFFLLGGHSLAAARLAAQIRRDFDADFPVRLVFAHPVLAEMARLLPQPQTPQDDYEEVLL